MEIKINEQHSIEHKNGYWIYHIYKKAKGGKKKGELHKTATQTYAKMLDMHHHAKLDGLCGEDIMKAVKALIDETQKQAGRDVMAERKKKLDKKDK